MGLWVLFGYAGFGFYSGFPFLDLQHPSTHFCSFHHLQLNLDLQVLHFGFGVGNGMGFAHDGVVHGWSVTGFARFWYHIKDSIHIPS